MNNNVDGKKSFIIYIDQRKLFDALPDDVAGKLIKMIFAYVNNEDPQSENSLLQYAFDNIKEKLHDDLVKWREIRQKRQEAGAIGGKANASKYKQMLANASNTKQREAVNVNVNVNDNVNVNVNDIDISNNMASAKAKPSKHKHGSYQHVLLTDDEYSKLKEQFHERTESLIQKLDDGIELKGYKYKSHYLAIIKWSKDDTPSKVKTNEYANSFKQNLANEMEEL